MLNRTTLRTFIRASVAVVLAMVVQRSWGSVTISTTNANIGEMHRKLARTKIECEREIARLERENREINKDKTEFRKALDSITVPEYRLVTNIVSAVTKNGDMVFDSNSRKITQVRKVKFKQDARVRRLAKILQDPRVCRIYEKYCDNSCAGVLEEFKAEWKMARENYDDTKSMMEGNSKSYASEVRKIDEDAKREYEESLKPIDEQIATLKRQRRQLREGVRRNNPLARDPPEIVEIDRELRRLEDEKKTLRRIYDSNKYTKSYASAQDRKTDANDAVLAAADLRDQLQNLFMVYNAKVKDDVFQVMNRKMAENKRLIESRNAQYARVEMLLRNPDLISPEVADAYMDKTANALIAEEFDIDRTKVMEAAKAQRAAEIKAAKDEEERVYQQELSRRRDAAQLAEAAENAKLERERETARLAEAAENAKLEREKERHRMAEEAATRDVRSKAAQEEANARIRRQQEAARREQLLFDEGLEQLKSRRRRLDAESNHIDAEANFINSLQESP